MIDRNDRRCTAFHEAGHAVAASFQGLPFARVFVVRDVDSAQGTAGELLGRSERNISILFVAGKPEEAKKEVITSSAGPIAETFAYQGLGVELPADNPDMMDAVRFVRYAYCQYTDNSDGTATIDGEDVNAKLPILNQAMNDYVQAAIQFTVEHRAAITRVALALLEKGELTPAEVAVLCRAA
jgi:hypothetical protein